MNALFHRATFKNNPSIQIELSRKNHEIMQPIQIQTIIDTGFSGGLRLPEEYKNQIEFSRISGYVERLFHCGQVLKRVPKYSLEFKILNQNNQPITVFSDYVLFMGNEYALLGMDFLMDYQCLFVIEGIFQMFSLEYFKNKPQEGRLRCKQMHELFSVT